MLIKWLSQTNHFSACGVPGTIWFRSFSMNSFAVLVAPTVTELNSGAGWTLSTMSGCRRSECSITLIECERASRSLAATGERCPGRSGTAVRWRLSAVASVAQELADQRHANFSQLSLLTCDGTAAVDVLQIFVLDNRHRVLIQVLDT